MGLEPGKKAACQYYQVIEGQGARESVRSWVRLEGHSGHMGKRLKNLDFWWQPARMGWLGSTCYALIL